MVARKSHGLGRSLAVALLVGSTGAALAGDDPPPSRLGRLFRLGGSSRSSSTTVGKPDPSADRKTTATASRPGSASPRPVSPAEARGMSLSPYGTLPPTPTANTSPAAPPSTAVPPLSPVPPAGNDGSRIAPQPRVSKAATESDPLVTRVSIGRSDDGRQFAMFVQIYADGTILDSEGVHRVGPDHLRPIAQLLQSGELAKLKGHCGGPSTDFIEQVHVVAYDRFHGRLRASSFSYSGNPQGCDPAVKQLNDAIDAITMKLAPPPTSAPPASAANASPTTATPPPSSPTSPANADAPPPPLASPPLGLTPDSEN